MRETYSRLIAALREFGPVTEEARKTSIHLTHGTAFTGVRVARRQIDLNIRTDTPLTSPRIRKAERVSVNRHHQVVRLAAPGDVDDELLAWLRGAYRLGG